MLHPYFDEATLFILIVAGTLVNIFLRCLLPRPPLTEEALHDVRAFLREHAGRHLRMVVERGMAGDIEYTTRSTRLMTMAPAHIGHGSMVT